MEPTTETARRFYRALRETDVAELLELTTTDLVGHVCAGMPGGLGGTHHGCENMLRDVWIPAYRSYRAMPHPEEFLPVDDDRVIVLGEYRGDVPGSDRTFAAAFAHVLQIRDCRIAAVRQITDTRCWPDADAIRADGVEAAGGRDDGAPR